MLIDLKENSFNTKTDISSKKNEIQRIRSILLNQKLQDIQNGKKCIKYPKDVITFQGSNQVDQYIYFEIKGTNHKLNYYNESKKSDLLSTIARIQLTSTLKYLDEGYLLNLYKNQEYYQNDSYFFKMNCMF